jgi:hypothetical protein
VLTVLLVWGCPRGKHDVNSPRFHIADASGGGMGGMMQDLAFAIPGVDEAMGFAEIMK